jgi:hypothetical protein
MINLPASKKFYTCVCVLALGLVVTTAYGQNAMVSKNPYYISIDHALPNNVVDIQDHLLSFSYNDRYGHWKMLNLKIINWKQEQVASLALDKSYGENYYNINLQDIASTWEIDKIYLCKFSDEAGHKYTLPIRPVPPPEKPGPVVDIVVNPILLQCDDLSTSLVEFVGSIKGGKAPFTVNWLVVDGSREHLLYQPHETVIQEDGLTPVITVDKRPDYHVVLQVKDACGNIEKKEVHLMCEEKDKKVNTLFVEPINDKKYSRSTN